MDFPLAARIRLFAILLFRFAGGVLITLGLIRGVVAELASSNRITQWVYSQTERELGLTWLRADEMVPLTLTWRDLILL